MRPALTAFCLCVLLGACGAWPDLPAVGAAPGAQPRLIPLGPILSDVDAALLRNGSTERAGLEARAADLRRRAETLQRRPL